MKCFAPLLLWLVVCLPLQAQSTLGTSQYQSQLHMQKQARIAHNQIVHNFVSPSRIPLRTNAQIQINLDVDGRELSTEIIKSSGFLEFDKALKDAVLKTGAFKLIGVESKPLEKFILHYMLD